MMEGAVVATISGVAFLAVTYCYWGRMLQCGGSRPDQPLRSVRVDAPIKPHQD